MRSRGVCVFACWCWWWCLCWPRHTPGYSSSRSTQLTGLRSNKILAALLLISGVWAWAIMSIKTARPATIKEQTVKVSQFLRACKEQTVILWTSAIGNFNIIRRQRACKEQKTIQGISAISNLYRYVDMLEHCSCLSCAELCVCV